MSFLKSLYLKIVAICVRLLLNAHGGSFKCYPDAVYYIPSHDGNWSIEVHIYETAEDRSSR